jgi:hypothetical protein
MEARSLLLGLVCLGAAACASDGSPPPSAARPALHPPSVFANRVRTADVSVFWNCTQPAPAVLQVDGVVQNIGGGTVRFARVEIVSVDARGRTIASVRADVQDQMLQTNQISPFQLSLRTVGAEARFDLFYEYRLRNRSARGGFDVSPERFRARDVCSETLGRVPTPQ